MTLVSLELWVEGPGAASSPLFARFYLTTGRESAFRHERAAPLRWRAWLQARVLLIG
jgi:hypothetical protein